ncbi:MAG: hypothetical protein Ct9H300mP28_30520 [Pseudomonadota bacterium]|nr:MAG: hypothetical protein Ct9H300mP28_30520 [Pseudomonadota bacterium]
MISIFFLRISNELYLKRLIAGGFDGVFEFVKDFRNEGIDRHTILNFQRWNFIRHMLITPSLMHHTEKICERVRWQ